MSNSDRVKYLRIALVVFGLIFLIGIYPLTIIWPSGWSWHTGQSDYLQDSGNLRHTGGIPVDRIPRSALSPKPDLVYGLVERGARWNHGSAISPKSRTHWAPLGGVLALCLVAIVLGLLTPRGATAAWRTA
jgi:hypothetical protein